MQLILWMRRCIALIILGAACFFGVLFFIIHNRSSIDFSVLEHYNPGYPSIVFDDEGNEWARFQLDRRKPIDDYQQIPKHLVQAFIAAEDWDFFNHVGVSFKGIARSTLVNLYRGNRAQGASTITQQLVKLLFFDSRKTFRRKFKEICCALLVERQFTKEQILQTYLNHICFGCGIYGVEAASQRFWGKSSLELTIDQAAVLAGIVRSPANYCPILYPLSAQKRRDSVLYKMHFLKFITQDEYADALNSSVVIKEYESNTLAPHLKESLRLFLEDFVGKDALYTGGLHIQTTLNKQMQHHAQSIVQAQCKKLRKTLQPDIDGAFISVATRTGEIKALVGGMDFQQSQFNRALQAKRQIGSTLKPLVYACAVESGMNFAQTEIDEPLNMLQGGQVWQPKNFNRIFNGEITLAYALSHSNNIVTIKTFLKVGAKPVIDLAKRCHIKGPFHPYPSLALGCVDSTLKEVVGMFNVFANNGTYVEPHYIKWIKDRWGTKIFKTNIQPESVLSTRVVGQVDKVLGLSLKRVYKLFPNKWFKSDAICKTGTTNDSRTCWFAGATPEFTTAIYIGCDDNRSMGANVYPIRTAFPIWLDFTRATDKKQHKFVYDPSLQEICIHEKTGVELTDTKKRGAVSILTT